MTNEEKINYTRRITQGNKSDIIVVLYDIYFSYEQDVRDAIASGDNKAFGIAIHKAGEVLSHLKTDLDFKYEISSQLFALYDYVQRCLAKVSYQKSEAELDNAAAVMKELREAFIEVAKSDSSGQQMMNAETVVAGYTYGRNSLNEMTDGTNRGFFA